MTAHARVILPVPSGVIGGHECANCHRVNTCRALDVFYVGTDTRRLYTYTLVCGECRHVHTVTRSEKAP